MVFNNKSKLQDENNNNNNEKSERYHLKNTLQHLSLTHFVFLNQNKFLTINSLIVLAVSPRLLGGLSRMYGNNEGPQ